jgi:hypothetical protein
VTAAGPDAGGGFRFRIPVWPLWCVYAALGAQAVTGFVAARRPAAPGLASTPAESDEQLVVSTE